LRGTHNFIGSSLFSFRYGQARKIDQHYHKFLTDRYGKIHKNYPPNAKYEDIEKDIEELLIKEFKENEYDEIVNPKEDIF
jgi:hypothetical protein